MLECLHVECSKRPEISFADFMRVALYDEKEGYYVRQKKRVGRSWKGDFYTAQSIGSVFFKLLKASIQYLLEEENLNTYTFIELGAEAGSPLPEEFCSAFKTVVRYGYKDRYERESLGQTSSPICKKAIVFSNELFDAQPFHRLLYTQGRWQELGVRLGPGDTLESCLLPELSPELAAYLPFLPKEHLEGYQLELSPGATELLKSMLQLSQGGLFLAFDYGYSWQELLYHKPQGTARAYYKHTISDKLLDRPGMQDLTCHVCWDFLTSTLKQEGYAPVSLKTQEAFFMQHALPAIQALVEEKGGAFSPGLQSLKELIHPQHMGHKFQVLSALKA